MNQQVLIKNYAIERSRQYGFDYAFQKAPRSPMHNLSGNKRPGETQIRWLKNRNKCNQFVGDVLTLSGFEMPTFKMLDGSLHYMNAERLPEQKKYFQKLSKLELVRAGDVLVVDDLSAKGENTAHTEIVTQVDFDKRQMRTTGARKAGAFEKDFSKVFAGLSFQEEVGAFKHPFKHAKIFFLRPIRLSKP